MRETREIAMEETVPRRQSFRNTPLRVLRAIGTSVVLVMLFAGNALAQAIAVTGTVTGAGGGPLAGVTVRISGTETRVLTNASFDPSGDHTGLLCRPHALTSGTPPVSTGAVTPRATRA